ncbi:Hypothetical predicted protein [Pelobates cultripes]|uniref:Uncharacterized protein n=1 Tax=Pelobates cultripes TaxID=61616 RepID=A0AAD1T7T3_PELCU|nr:Hypothetical predicted protein [Pelobates cultripes]
MYSSVVLLLGLQLLLLTPTADHVEKCTENPINSTATRIPMTTNHRKFIVECKYPPGASVQANNGKIYHQHKIHGYFAHNSLILSGEQRPKNCKVVWIAPSGERHPIKCVSHSNPGTVLPASASNTEENIHSNLSGLAPESDNKAGVVWLTEGVVIAIIFITIGLLTLYVDDFISLHMECHRHHSFDKKLEENQDTPITRPARIHSSSFSLREDKVTQSLKANRRYSMDSAMPQKVRTRLSTEKRPLIPEVSNRNIEEEEEKTGFQLK